ncbi:MAG: hypothetical protein WBP61_13495 [Nocardioides sp.]
MTGRLACRQPSRSLPALTLLVVALLAGCTIDAPQESRSSDRSSTGSTGGCGPLTFDQVRGAPPRFVKRKRLDRWPNDAAACAGVWLRTGSGFVPQGVVVEDGTAWVSGFNARAPVGSRYCALETYDVRTGEQLARLTPVTGQVGDRPQVSCRHGGGLVADEHGLWLVETDRLWLLDPETLAVARAWALLDPLRGSFALLDGTGHLGIGGWHPHRRSRIHYFDTDALVASSILDLTPDVAVAQDAVPSATQGAVWAGSKQGVWYARSVTRCGVLVGAGPRRGFVPGAEGMDLEGDSLWVVSESGTRHYQEQGGRPLVPQLVRLDVSRVAAWSRPRCEV